MVKIKCMKKSAAVSAISALAVAAVIICAITALRERDSLRLNEPVYTVINGMKTAWPDGVTLWRRDRATTIREKKQTQFFQSYPLISETDGRIILQKSCSLNRTSDDLIVRADYFTSVSKEEGSIVLRRGEKEAKKLDGFLYDNEDTYIFLERALLQWEDENVAIEPMTVIQVSYMEYLQIFAPGLEPRFEQIATDTVTAEFESGKKLNLATDRYYMENNSWRLLFLPLDMLPEMTAEGERQ